MYQFACGHYICDREIIYVCKFVTDHSAKDELNESALALGEEPFRNIKTIK